MFFNALGIKYEYEPEGYDLGNGLYYLPDFWLPEQDCWVEVKGNKTLVNPKDIKKCQQLAIQSRKLVCMVFECRPFVITKKFEELNIEGDVYYFSPKGDWDACWAIGYCTTCNSYRFGLFGDWCSVCHDEMIPINKTIYEAYTKARQARFEYSARRRW